MMIFPASSMKARRGDHFSSQSSRLEWHSWSGWIMTCSIWVWDLQKRIVLSGCSSFFSLIPFLDSNMMVSRIDIYIKSRVNMRFDMANFAITLLRHHRKVILWGMLQHKEWVQITKLTHNWQPWLRFFQCGKYHLVIFQNLGWLISERVSILDSNSTFNWPASEESARNGVHDFMRQNFDRFCPSFQFPSLLVRIDILKGDEFKFHHASAVRSQYNRELLIPSGWAILISFANHRFERFCIAKVGSLLILSISLFSWGFRTFKFVLQQYWEVGLSVFNRRWIRPIPQMLEDWF